MPPSKPPFKHWLSLCLAILAVIAFIAYSPQQGGIIYEMMGGSGYGVGISSNVAPPSVPTMMEDYAGSGQAAPTRDMSTLSSMPDYYPYPYPGDATAKDTREFLKQSYNATLRTRDVNDLTQRVVTTVRGHEGRVDNTQSSEKYGYVQFVLPITQFESFKKEVEGMVGSRFLKVEMSAQNLLPQKQSIEEQQKQADTALVDYEASRDRIVSAHTSATKSLQAQVNSQSAMLSDLRGQPSSVEINTQILQLEAVLIEYRQRLIDENASYAKKLAVANANIKYAKDRQKAIETQDQNLLDNVATVNGTISVQWISYWEMARLYLPGYWIPAILALLSVLAFMWESGRLGRFRKPL